MKKDKKIFLKELKAGLSKRNKMIPSKFHYDLLGSKYFEKITQQKEYYPTRKEKEILRKLSKKIPSLFKGSLSFVEIGSGAIDKIKILLNKNVKFYIPLDISLKFVRKSVSKLKKKYPKLKVKPIKIDYSKPFKIPKFQRMIKICFFLGSSIGNFYNNEEIDFLKNIKKSIGKNNYLFVGVDLIKNKKIIEKAYNDKKGYTAKFSLNLINIINRNFNTGLKIKNFYYKGKFNRRLKCVQGFIVSKINQSFFIDKKRFFLRKNENIQVEISNKFTIKSFIHLSRLAQWGVEKYWLDRQKYFAIFLLKS